jgi:hypothetical protein
LYLGAKKNLNIMLVKKSVGGILGGKTEKYTLKPEKLYET